MSDFDRNSAAARGFGADRAVAIDQGLRAHMIRVYNYMAGGVALTGVVAWLAYQAAGGDAIRISGNFVTGATPFGQAILSGPLMWVLLFAPLGLVLFLSYRIGHLQASTARLLFFVYAGVLGLGLTPIFAAYTHGSIARVFFLTAASFGALSLWGYTTQRNLDAMGAFLVMGLFGLLLAMVVSFFWPSGPLQFAISVIGVLIFAGLTAWDTQRIKEFYDPMDDGTVAGRKAVIGALRLYLDFLNMFLFLLQLFGDRR
jgi:FtsH-binding integral membrane protein